MSLVDKVPGTTKDSTSVSLHESKAIRKERTGRICLSRSLTSVF
jgi:hypothetical protein